MSKTVSGLERMDVVVVGHVDHGKSTVIGRLMADTGSLPDGKLERVKAMCAANARPFEYAFLLDALKNEQAQGITIDTARCFFDTDSRHYIIHDAPGHVEFLKNMITGASRAQAALLVIDAHEGVKENSKRHGYILSMLGIRQISVLVNKMDLLGWDRSAFEKVAAEYAEFLGKLGVRPTSFVPISARDGVNITTRGTEADWYEGPTVIEQIEAFQLLDDDVERPFRMPLQDVYKFTAEGDDRRIFVGTVETGRLKSGDDVTFWPSGKTSTVRSIEVLQGERPTETLAGQATGFTLETQVYVRPGELVARTGELAPVVASRVRATVFWMASAPLVPGTQHILRIGASRVPVVLEQVLSVLDASELESVAGATQVERHDVAEIVMRTTRPVALDPAVVLEATSRFVIVAGYDIAGCGIVLEAMAERGDETAAERAFISGTVSAEARKRRYLHGGQAIIVSSGSSTRSFEVASKLESRLFDLGVHSYLLASARETGDRDVLARDAELVRLGEVACAMADAGVVFVGAIANLDTYEIERLRALGAPHGPVVVNLSEDDASGADLRLPADASDGDVAGAVLRLLSASGVLPEYEI